MAKSQHDGKTVLVVNDDPIQLRLLAGILEKDGLQVFACQSAEAGMACLQANSHIDALVTDLHMPGIDGWRFCRLLRSPEYAASNDLPILVVSATFAGDHAQEITRDLGANAFLSMPCQARVLRDTVHCLLGGQTTPFSPKVLIVEDSPTLAKLLTGTFQEHGYEASFALTGKEGHRQFQEINPELVILDYHLPDLSGEVLLREFKQAASRPAVIMITTDVNPQLASRFLNLGANGYLRKPFDPCYLVELSDKVRRERALLRVEDILENRTLELRESNARLRESEARLRESEANYRLLVGNLPGVVFTGYADFSVDFFDDKIKELTGFSREEFTARRRNWRDLIISEDRATTRQAFLQALKTDQKYVREYRIRTLQGDVIWIRERSQIVLQPDGRIAFISGIFNNISELKRLEEESLRLDKLESLGILAGGIAHDFNNLLTVILGNINLAALTQERCEPELNYLSKAEQACLQAKALSQQLLTFAKGGAPIKKVGSCIPVIQEAAHLALVGSRCLANLALPETLWAVEVDPGQLCQALCNILINADQAMTDGGLITVEAENVVLVHKVQLPLPPGDYVKIAISDQGMGIDAKYLGKVFDPYFTTKPKGNGLGLATAFSIVKKHGGHLTGDSVTGAGATFTLYLPAVSQSATPAAPALNAVPTGQGKILVMDDEPLVRDIAQKMLRHLGYQVGIAVDGAEALEKYHQAQAEGQPFDAVILDLTIPGGMGGKETIDRLLSLDPQVRAIVSSGYCEDSIMTNFSAYGFHESIRKPYRVKELAEVLTSVLLFN